MPRQKLPSEKVLLKLPPSQRQKLRDEARRRKTTMSHVASEIIERAIPHA